jgi:Endoplasmic reticulum vesicle transporter
MNRFSSNVSLIIFYLLLFFFFFLSSGVFFVYDVSPFMITVTRHSSTFTQFITSLFAILGGVLTLAKIVDAATHFFGDSPAVMAMLNGKGSPMKKSEEGTRTVPTHDNDPSLMSQTSPSNYGHLPASPMYNTTQPNSPPIQQYAPPVQQHYSPPMQQQTAYPHNLSPMQTTISNDMSSSTWEDIAASKRS